MRKFFYKVIKRAFDIIASLAGIIVTSPLWLVAIIGIEISDPGPVFYMARRVVKNNKVVSMFKFRSMRQGKANEASFRGDVDRIFPFGKLIRRLKIDELPQLLNIFLGHMSVVGPRPAAPDQVPITRGGKFGRIAEVPAGLTGPSALYDYIYGDSVEDEEEYARLVLPTRLELDLYYINHKSTFFDLRLIWWTVVCIINSLFKRTPKRIFKKLLKYAEISQKETAIDETLTKAEV